MVRVPPPTMKIFYKDGPPGRLDGGTSAIKFFKAMTMPGCSPQSQKILPEDWQRTSERLNLQRNLGLVTIAARASGAFPGARQP